MFDRVFKGIDKALTPEEEKPKPSYYDRQIERINKHLARLEEIERQAQPLPKEAQAEKPSELAVACRETIEPNCVKSQTHVGGAIQSPPAC